MILFPQNHQLYTVPQWPARFKLSVDSFAEHFWCGERWTPQCSACPVQFRSTSWNYFNSHVFQVDFWTVPQSGELRIQSQKLELGTLTKNVYRFSACMSWDAELLFFVTTYQYKLWNVAISIWGSSKNLPAEVMHKDNFSTPCSYPNLAIDIPWYSKNYCDVVRQVFSNALQEVMMRVSAQW